MKSFNDPVFQEFIHNQSNFILPLDLVVDHNKIPKNIAPGFITPKNWHSKKLNCGKCHRPKYYHALPSILPFSLELKYLFPSFNLRGVKSYKEWIELDIKGMDKRYNYKLENSVHWEVGGLFGEFKSMKDYLNSDSFNDYLNLMKCIALGNDSDWGQHQTLKERFFAEDCRRVYF